MKCIVLFVLALLSCTVDSLKCYYCDSFKSFEDCEKSSEEIICPEAFDQCVKIELEYTYKTTKMKSFAKNCHKAEHCSTDTHEPCKDASKSDPNSKCYITCCRGDRCNAAHQAVVSGSLITSCTVSMVILQYTSLTT